MHNIHKNEVTGQHSFFSYKQKAWHQLGKVVDEYPTSADAMEYAGLNFTVERRPLLTYDSSNFYGDPELDVLIAEVDVPNYYATVRTDTDQVLGVVGSDYHVMQNVEAFAFFDNLVGAGNGIKYETAGALGNGERIFITAKLPDYIHVVGDDLLEKYLLLTTSHDGSSGITAAFTPVRVVCQNTLNSALRNLKNHITFRHTANAKQRLDNAHELLGITSNLSQVTEDRFRFWSKVQITDPEVKRLIELAMAPSKEVLEMVHANQYEEWPTVFKNTCEKVLEYAMTAESQQTQATRGTVYGAYNAVSGYFQNVRSYRSPESKMKNIFYGGTAQQRTQKAFEICDSYVVNGALALHAN
ncbi:DUF932 domain-containing protein [Chitinophaga alhagiae]|uniref:DUF932 domain-containing protein n=1 Tax=Chitinophaga alhagiae TaxID=2203219 RepID=UPI000E5ADB11|nr:DUF932 domain-containing protein [Chitinophaga alhagiae]